MDDPMRLRSRLTLLFTDILLLTTLAFGISLSFVARAAIEDLVEEESREMVKSITDTLRIFRDSDFNTTRNFGLERSIGKTGFCFVLNADGTYVIHPNDSVQ